VEASGWRYRSFDSVSCSPRLVLVKPFFANARLGVGSCTTLAPLNPKVSPAPRGLLHRLDDHTRESAGAQKLCSAEASSG